MSTVPRTAKAQEARLRRALARQGLYLKKERDGSGFGVWDAWGYGQESSDGSLAGIAQAYDLSRAPAA